MGGTGTKTMAPVPKLWHRCQVSGTGSTNNRISGTGAKIVALVPIFGTGARHICLNLNKSPLTWHRFRPGSFKFNYIPLNMEPVPGIFV